MVASGWDVAPGGPNKLAPRRLGLCVLDIAPPAVKGIDAEPDKKDADGPRQNEVTGPDEYLHGLQCLPVAEAYVALTPAGGDAGKTIYGRTSKGGTFLRVDKSALGTVPPNDPAHWFFIEEGKRYDVFWAYDKAHFEHGLRFIGQSSPFGEHAFTRLVTRRTTVAEKELGKFFGHWSDVQRTDVYKLAMLLHNVGRAGTGYFTLEELSRANWNVSAAGIGWKRGTAFIFPHGDLDEPGKPQTGWAFARRPAVAAVYLAEFVVRYVLRASQGGAWEYAQMEEVLAIVEAAKRGERVPELDAQLLGRDATKDKPALPGNLWGEDYYRWAHDCGLAKSSSGAYVSPKTFEASLYGVFGYGKWPADYFEWHDAAVAIRKDFHAVHPSLDRGFSEGYKPLYTADPVIAYFDFYQFGAQQDDPQQERYHHGWMAHYPVARQTIKQAVEDASSQAREELRAEGNCVKLWLDAALHAKGDQALHNVSMRFLEVCEDVAYDWWEGWPLPAKKEKAKPGAHGKPASGAHEREQGGEKEGGGEGAHEKEGEKEIEVEVPDQLKDLIGVMKSAFTPGAKQNELLESFFARRSRTYAQRVTKALDRFHEQYEKIRYIDHYLVKNGLEDIREGDVTLQPVIWYKRFKRHGRVAIADEGWIIIKRKGEEIGRHRIVVCAKSGGKKGRTLRAEAPEPEENAAVAHLERDAERLEEEARHAERAAAQATQRFREAPGYDVELGRDQLEKTSAAQRARAKATRAKARHARAVEAEEVEEVVEAGKWGKVPKGFERLSGGASVMKVPHWFSGFAYVALIGINVHELLEYLQAEDAKAREKLGIQPAVLVLELTANVGLAMASFGEAVELTFAKLAEESIEVAAHELHSAEHALAEATSAEAKALLQDLTTQLRNKEKWAVRKLSAVEGFGKMGRLFGKVAIVAETILVAREGMLTLIESDDQAMIGHGRRATALAISGWVKIGGATVAAGAVVVSGVAGLATGGLALAAVGVITAFIDIYMWIWGERKTSMDEVETNLVKAVASEFGLRFAPKEAREGDDFEVCRTGDRVSGLVSHVKGLRASLPSMYESLGEPAK
jgi:hypothetical protein